MLMVIAPPCITTLHLLFPHHHQSTDIAQHKDCPDRSERHYHQSVTQCPLCYFFPVQSVSPPPVYLPESVSIFSDKKLNISYLYIKSGFLYHFYLRAPPVPVHP